MQQSVCAPFHIVFPFPKPFPPLKVAQIQAKARRSEIQGYTTACDASALALGMAPFLKP